MGGLMIRVCPRCGYRDPPIWRPAKIHNPSGDIDIARLDDVKAWQPKVERQLEISRGKKAVIEGVFAYYIGKRGVWVRRVAAQIYRDCGMAAFKPPYETSKHNKLQKQVSGRTKTTFTKKLVVELKEENKT